jgi:hypothetical protein
MNPFRWTSERQLAGAVICLIGGISGVLFAWIESPFRSLAIRSPSGEWSDYTGVFLLWLQKANYWPWPVLGATIFGLVFYAAQLLRNST